MNRMTFAATIAAGCFVLAAAILLTAAPGDGQAALRIGVVDFQTLLEKYDKMKDAQAEMKAVEDVVRAEATKREQELDQLKKKLAQHTEGSEPYEQTLTQIRAKNAEAKAWFEGEMGKFAVKQRNYLKEIYGDTERAAEQYAKDNGLSLIFKEDRIQLDVPTAQEIDLRVTLKKILYRADSLSITDELVVIMNAEYQKQKPAPAEKK